MMSEQQLEMGDLLKLLSDNYKPQTETQAAATPQTLTRGSRSNTAPADSIVASGVIKRERQPFLSLSPSLKNLIVKQLFRQYLRRLREIDGILEGKSISNTLKSEVFKIQSLNAEIERQIMDQLAYSGGGGEFAEQSAKIRRMMRRCIHSVFQLVCAVNGVAHMYDYSFTTGINSALVIVTDNANSGYAAARIVKYFGNVIIMSHDEMGKIVKKRVSRDSLSVILNAKKTLEATITDIKTPQPFMSV